MFTLSFFNLLSMLFCLCTESPDPHYIPFLQRHHWGILTSCITVWCSTCTISSAALWEQLRRSAVSLFTSFWTFTTPASPVEATGTAGDPTHLAVSPACCCWGGDCTISGPKPTGSKPLSCARQSGCSTPWLLCPYTPPLSAPPLTLGHRLCPRTHFTPAHLHCSTLTVCHPLWLFIKTGFFLI